VKKTKENKSTLLAIALGDGFISDEGSLRIIHCAKQKEYLEYKARLLEKILEKEIQVIDFDNNGYPGCRLSISNKYFKTLRKFLYSKDRKKIISTKVLNRLTPNGLAIWYMDDGNIALHKRGNIIHSREIYLNTYCTYEEGQNIQKYFIEKYDVYFRISPSKGKFRMICNTTNAKKFIEIVKDFIIPSMYYKIDMKYNTPVQQETIDNYSIDDIV
jgi:hypothetical protein